MSRFFKKLTLIVLGLFVFNLILYLGWIAHNLKTRYPDLDFSTARLGIASWYSQKDKNINKHTANGDIFNDKKMTCASWFFPFDQKLVVINAFTGKWIECRVNDRGPAKRLNREIDLTLTAFKKLAHQDRGLIYVAVLPVPTKD